MNDMSQFTGLGRPIDFKYPTNRAISLLSAVVIVGVFLWQVATGVEFVQSILVGLSAGVSVFVAWAIARELDPDNDYSAFVGAGLALIGGLAFGFAGGWSLIALFGLMQTLRVLNRSTGLSPTVGDSVLVLIGTAVVSYFFHPVVAFVIALALFLDTRLPKGESRHLLFAGLALVVGLIVFVIQLPSLNLALPQEPLRLLIVLVTSVGFLVVIAMTRMMESKGDMSDVLLSARRVQAGQAIALLFALLITLLAGDLGVIEVFPLWSAMLGIGVYRGIKPVLPR